jgi:hypothetical protein
MLPHSPARSRSGPLVSPGRGAQVLRLSRLLRGLAVLFFCLASTAPVQARGRHKSAGRGERDERSAAQAERLRSDGTAALQAAKYSEAARLLSQAYATSPSPQGLFLLGRLALSEGRSLDAHDLLRRFLADPDLDHEGEAATPAAAPAPAPAPTPGSATGGSPGPAAAPPAPALTGLAADIKEAERVVALPRPPAGTLNILGERGTLIYVDGRLVGTLPLSLPLLLSPSEHRVLLERGQKRIEDQVQIAAGRLGELRGDVSSRALLFSILPGVLFVSDFRNVPPELRARLQQSVEKALLARRLSPLSTEIALSALPSGGRKLSDCLGEVSCQVELASRVEAEAILVVRSVGEGERLQLRVALLDGAVAEEAAAEEQVCQRCNLEQAGSSLLALVGRVYEAGRGRARAELSVTCEPSSAELLIDSKVVTGCRYKKTVFAGEHRIIARQSGLPSEERLVTLRAGESRALSLQLSLPEPPPAPLAPEAPSGPLPPQQLRRPAWRLAVGSVALVGGLVMAGFGVTMLGIDGSCVRDPAVTGGACERKYTTLAPGAGLFGGGLNLAMAGIVFLGIPGPFKK